MKSRERGWTLAILPLLTLVFLTKSTTFFGKHSSVASNYAISNSVASVDQAAPSYIQLCSELSRRLENDNNDDPPFVVQEQSVVCDSAHSFSSLMTMIASSWIAEAAASLNLVYRHGCHQKELLQKTTIQQMLPKELRLDGTHEILQSMSTVRNMCQRCLLEMKSGIFPHVDCLGFPVQTKELSAALDVPELVALFTAFRSNLREAIRRIDDFESSNKKRDTPEVVVYLDSEKESETIRTMALPLHYYGEIMPPFVESISIAVSPSCLQLLQCQEHSQIMGRYFLGMYPRAKFEIEMIPSTALAYARLMKASIVICPPSTFCLLPGLLKDPSHEIFLTESPEVYPWFSQVVRHSSSKIYLQKASRMPVLALSPGGESLSELAPFLHQPPNSGGYACPTIRGRSGRWEQDMDYAKEAQYTTPLKRFREFPDFTPTPQQPFRSSTTYRWLDDACPINVVSREGMCQAMQSMGLTRVYIVGDSLNMQMAQSLWKLLGHDDDPVIRPSKAEWQESMRFQWNRTVDCPSQSFGFELVYTRNDLLNRNLNPLSLDKIGKDFNCGFAEYCLPWIPQYVNYDKGGTLLIANAGSHIHGTNDFEKASNDFVELMDHFQKSRDVVMIRTTVPGHNGCQDPNVKPYISYHDFARDMVEDFRSWHLFSAYNDYVHKIIRERNSQKQQNRIHMLDVFPMTILRKDGHISGPQKCSTCKDDDCLHYILPGPLDWWVHLMYSNLQNMAFIKSKLQSESSS